MADSPVDYSVHADDLRRRIADAARATWDKVRAEYPDDRFYLYTIYSSWDASYLSPTCSSEEGLADVAADLKLKYPQFSNDPSDMRWSYADTPFLDEGEEFFAEINQFLASLGPPWSADDETYLDRLEVFVEFVVEVCSEALGDLDRAGYFGIGVERDRVVVNLVSKDQTNRAFVENAKRLNPPTALDRLLSEVPVTEARGDITYIGTEEVWSVDSLVVAVEPGLVAACGEGAFGVWRIGTAESILWHDFEPPRPAAVALPSDGKSLFYSLDGSIHRLSLPSGDETAVWSLHDRRINSLAVTSAGDLLASAVPGGIIIGTDAESGQERWRVEMDVASLDFSPDGRFLAIGSRGVRVLDARGGTTIREFVPFDEPDRRCAVAWSADGRALGVVDYLSRGGQLHKHVDPGPATLRVWHDLDDLIMSVDLPGRGLIAGPRGLAFAPAGSRIATVHNDGELYVWSVPSGELIANVRGRWRYLYQVSWLDDHRVIAVGKDPDCSPPIGVWTIP